MQARVRISGGSKAPEPRLLIRSFTSVILAVRFETAGEQRPRERCGSSEGEASKGEPHERSRHETRPGRFEEEKTVKRVRNPEDGTALGLWQAPGSSGLLELTRAEEDQTP